jgi:hypothetical protein
MQNPDHNLRRRREALIALRMLIVAMWALCAGPAAAGAPTAIDLSQGAEAPALVSLPSPVGPLEYTPGRGMHLGHMPVTIGGYANVDLERDEAGPARLALDDLSFFVIADPTPRLHLFSELELENLLEVDDHGHGGTVDNIFTAERLYGDFSVSDHLNVRVGKFLTPVGRWNVIHAQPLVWTTSRPLATLLPFDPHTTGAMLFGSIFSPSAAINYSLFGQVVNQLDAVPEPQTADRSGGARLEYATDAGAAFGATYLAFRHAGNWQHLGGLDTAWRRGPMELMGELAYEDGPHAGGAQWGLYLQSALEVLAKLYLVGRYEHFDQRGPIVHPEVNLVILGLAYKPAPFAILKAEYLIADHRAAESPPGFRSSFAILF